MTVKLYCYIDESGQDTQSEIFVVAVIVAEGKRDEILDLCERLEILGGKGKDKWGKAKHSRRMRYLEDVFSHSQFKNTLRFKVFLGKVDYDSATIEAISSAVCWGMLDDEYTTLVYVDGLSKTKRREYSPRLCKLGLNVRQVRGIRKDETDALIRLADAIAGFVRDAHEGKSAEIVNLFNKAIHEGVLVELT